MIDSFSHHFEPSSLAYSKKLLLHPLIKAGDLVRIRLKVDGLASKEEKISVVNRMDEEDYNCLQRAAMYNQHEIVSYLISIGAQINAIAPLHKGVQDCTLTALCIAVNNSFFRVVDILTQQPGILVNDYTNNEHYPLLIRAVRTACRDGHANILRCLLEVDGVDLNMAGTHGYMAIHEAAQDAGDINNKGRLDAMKALLDKGESPVKPNYLGTTPTMLCDPKGPMHKLLLDRFVASLDKDKEQVKVSEPAAEVMAPLFDLMKGMDDISKNKSKASAVSLKQ